jgi:hypothetical protein
MLTSCQEWRCNLACVRSLGCAEQRLWKSSSVFRKLHKIGLESPTCALRVGLARDIVGKCWRMSRQKLASKVEQDEMRCGAVQIEFSYREAFVLQKQSRRNTAPQAKPITVHMEP